MKDIYITTNSGVTYDKHKQKMVQSIYVDPNTIKQSSFLNSYNLYLNQNTNINNNSPYPYNN